MSTPGTGGSTITAYEWFIVGKPEGSTPSFVNDAIQNPTLQNLPSRGTVLAMLVVTDNLGQVSETDPAKAPDSAFYRFSLRTNKLAVQVPAAGQRNWDDEFLELVDVLDSFRNTFNVHTIASHDTTATGAQLNTLVGGGNADSLHTHAGLTGISAVGTLGRIELATAPTDAAHPKALTREIFLLHGDCSGEVAVRGTAGGDPSAAQIMIYVPTSVSVPAITLGACQITLADGGGTSGDDWEFELWQMTAANYKLNAFVASGSATLIEVFGFVNPTVANEPLSEAANIAHTFVAAQNHLVLRCTKAPSTPGAGLSFTTTATRQW